VSALDVRQHQNPTKNPKDLLEDAAIRVLGAVARGARELQLILYSHRVSQDPQVKQRITDVRMAHKSGQTTPSLSADEAVERVRNKAGL